MGKDLNAINTIIDCIRKAQKFSDFSDITDFTNDEMAFDACIRNIEVIGEAVKRLSSEIRKNHPEIEWSQLAGFRDRLIHQYDKVDARILWATLKSELPLEIPKLEKIKQELLQRKTPTKSQGNIPKLF